MSLLKKVVSLAILAGSLFAVGCDNNQMPPETGVDIPEFTPRTLPIINGTRVTGRDYYSTVALVVNYGYGGYSSICTGTLITPNYVMTAAHCISKCDPNDSDYRPYMYIGFGQSDSALTNVYEIEAFYPHPKFVCREDDISNDIAILKLKKAVPLSVATPTLPLPPQFALKNSEIDSGSGVQTTTVGFGKTNFADDYSSGTKYKTSRTVYAICPLHSNGSKRCNYSTYDKGFIFFDFTNTGTCQGDSGGPTFVTRNGYEFVAGITSYGFGKCDSYDAVTNVSDYYDFIQEKVTDLASGDPEDCFNQEDDNGDGRIDCDDPYCFVQKSCIPEDCFNKIDDNGDGFTDCDDDACKSELRCQPEICNDGLDNNGNGLIDCNEASCFVQLICQPEICDDNIDNNGDGNVDCADPKCAKELRCQKEDCFNGKDDNGNGLADCNDPECSNEKRCQPEICNDNVDNNDNGIIDCAEASCTTSAYCQPEVCNDTIDNNLDGLVDCDDPQCTTSIYCLPEICDDGKDNNANGLIDCDEASCEETCSSGSGCSIQQGHTTPVGLFMLFLMGCLPFIRIRRRT